MFSLVYIVFSQGGDYNIKPNFWKDYSPLVPHLNTQPLEGSQLDRAWQDLLRLWCQL